MAKLERVYLTSGRITSFACPSDRSQAFLWDSEVPGLAVRATPPGKRSPKGGRAFIFQGYLDGSTPRITIGDTKVWQIEKARIEARRLQSLLDQGIDPREQKRELAAVKTAALAAKEAANQEAENRKQYTLQALCEAYSNLLDAKGKAQSANQTRSIFKCHVYEAQTALATVPAREITAHQITAIIRHVSEQGKDRTAGILRSYLSAAYNAARKAPFDAKLPSALIVYGIESNPVEPVSTIAVKRGNRTLSPDELKNYMAALGEDLADQALKLALYAGGQRMAQLLRAKVSSYDAHTQTIRLWDGKGKRSTPREHLLPLAPKAAAIVRALIERAERLEQETAKKEGREPSFSNLWLFSSAGKTQLVETTPGKRAHAICEAMKCDAFDLRDIRRTCETMLAGVGISRDTRAQLLSHGLSGVQAAHYDRHTYTDEKRAALISWEQRLEEIATGKIAVKQSRPKNIR
jgi:integrase